MAEAISKEDKQIVLAAMQKLPSEQQIVLTMRCYDQLSFPRIAEQLGCREFRARALYSRAEKSLAENLVKHGLGNELLQGALLIFGKMTATSEASAADIAITGLTQSVT